LYRIRGQRLLRQAFDRDEAELRMFVADRPILLVSGRAVPSLELIEAVPLLDDDATLAAI
jgi:hypothetical protein